jgi:hypothetical protein
MISNILKILTGSMFSAWRNIQFYRPGKTQVTIRICHALAIGVALVTLGATEVAKGHQPTYSPGQVRTYSRSDIERLIRDVERSSQDFQRDFDTWLDGSGLDGQRREDVYNRQVQDLTSALNTLRSNFNRRNDWWVARGDMQRVLSAATSVNSIISNREVRGGLNRQWGALRRNINRLADAFNLPPVGTTFGGFQTYPEYGGNIRACTVTGTFRGYTNTGGSELTIAANGTATARSLSSNEVYTGRCANNVLYFDWGSFNVVREGRNIATVEIGNERNRTSYRRVSGFGGDTRPSYPDQYGDVPSWAVGTFRGMTNDGESELTIEPNGVATARSLNSNTLHTGRYSNGILTFDWGSFQIDREDNGIRTVEVRNPRNRTSYRRISGYQGDTRPSYPDQYGNVPSWAIGTFRGRTNDGESELTISPNGVATARSLASNAVFTGQYANGVLTFDWGSFRVIQEGSGFRTVEINNERNRTSYRRVN